MSGKQNRKRAWGICVVATVAAIAVLSAGSPVWAETIAEVDDLAVYPAGSVTSAFMVDGVPEPGAAAGAFWIDFDTAVVSVTNVTAGQLPNDFYSNVTDGTDGVGGIDRLWLTGKDLSGGQSGDVVFANITWTAVGSVGDSCVLDVISRSDLFDDDYNYIPHSTIDGNFTIVPEPSSLVLLASLAVSGGLMVLWRRRRR